MQEFRGVQGGYVVFGTSGKHAFREVISYAAKYAIDGDVYIEEKRGKKWVRVASITQASAINDAFTVSL